MRKLLFSEYLTCDTAQVCLSILYYHNVPNPWNNNNDNVCYLLAEMASAWLYCYYCCCCCRCRDGDLSATRSVGQTSHAVVVKMILCLWGPTCLLSSRAGDEMWSRSMRNRKPRRKTSQSKVLLLLSFPIVARVECRASVCTQTFISL